MNGSGQFRSLVPDGRSVGVIGPQANPDHIPVAFRNIRVLELKK